MEKFVRLSEERPLEKSLCDIKTNVGSLYKCVQFVDGQFKFDSTKFNETVVSWRYSGDIIDTTGATMDIITINKNINANTSYNKESLDDSILLFLREKGLLHESCTKFKIVINEKEFVLNDLISEFVLKYGSIKSQG